MSAKLIVAPTEKGIRPWKVVFEDYQILGYTYTQDRGYEVARSWLENNGGGEIIVLDKEGNFQKKDVIKSNPTPCRINGIKPERPFE